VKEILPRLKVSQVDNLWTLCKRDTLKNQQLWNRNRYILCIACVLKGLTQWHLSANVWVVVF